MIATLALVLGSFAWLIVRSYRAAGREGRDYRPEGKLRWSDTPE